MKNSFANESETETTEAYNNISNSIHKILKLKFNTRLKLLNVSKTYNHKTHKTERLKFRKLENSATL